MEDFSATINSDGGAWSETEVLGNRAIVKVKASAQTLQTLDAEFKRLPKTLLTDSLSDLSLGVKTAIKNELLDMGYTLTEIVNALGADIGQKTFADLLRFIATRRLKPRYDSQSDTIVCDGDVQTCKSVDIVNGEVI
jgi:hypothetical protein